MSIRRRRLAGQRVIVTGASSGVGRATALELARRGAHVMATARRADRLKELAAAPAGAGSIIHEAGDICDPAFRDRLVATATDRLGGLDGVVAAAGGGAIGRFRDLTAETFARIIDLDLVAPAELVRRSLPHLAAGHDPVVVLVGSILGLHPLPLHGDYCAAKAALRSLAGTLRMELAADGIEVLLVNLGPTASEFWDALVVGQRPPWSRGRRMPADRAAAAIAAGMERRHREITPGWQAKGFAIAARFLPGLIDRVAGRHLRAAVDAAPVRKKP
ncbi:MAG: SDR family NAD(P)-dependent oxidoreductase [Planctomycetia bacterium]|nr:SDR family NAD(P)-dependent oxidoreductase [Planctomycetia bacterium]